MPEIILTTEILIGAGVVLGAVFLVALHVALRRRGNRVSAELASLNEIGRELLRAQLNVEGLCELVYRRASEMIETSYFQLGLFNGDDYVAQVWVRDSERLPVTRFEGGAHRGIVGWVRQTGQPLLVRDFEAERDSLPAYPEFKLDAPPQSGLFVPLIAGEATIGVVAIQSREPRRFTAEHQRLLTALANQAAWSIRNAQLYENSQYRAEQLRLIGQISAEISSVQPLPDLFRQIVTLVKSTFGYYCVSIFEHTEGGLQVAASTDDVFQPQMRLTYEGMVTWAYERGQTALANNVAQDVRYHHLISLPETRSEISVPLKVEDRVLGVLDVQSDRVNAFSSEDVFLLETLSAQIALAIEQAQTYAAERRLAERLEALIQISQAVVSVLDLDELLDRVVDLIVENFGFERVYMFLRQGGRLVFRAGAGAQSVEWLIEEYSLALNDAGPITQVARSGEPVLIGDAPPDPRDEKAGIRSELVVPIKLGGRVLGVIDLQSEQIDAFSPDDLLLMQAFADSVAVAARNATLYAAERRRRNLAETLAEISSTLVSDLDLDHVLVGILDGLSRVVMLENAAILLFNREAGTLTLASAIGTPVLSEVVGQALPLDLLDLGQDVDTETAVTHLFHVLLEIHPGDPHATIAAPLTVGSAEIGYLLIHHHTPDRYSTNDIEIVQAFANQAAIAINNARLYSSQQAEAYVTTVLLQVAEAVNAQPDAEDALETIARLTALLAGVSCCLILRWDPEQHAYCLRAQHGLDSVVFRIVRDTPLPAADYPFLDLMTVADRPYGAGEGYQLPLPQPLGDLMGVGSILGLPLHAKRGVVGLLVVDDPAQRHITSPRLLSILTGIAHQAATVLESALLQSSAAERERLERELELAHSIQASFIPKSPPTLPGWEIAAAWRSARQVSGDFYDFIPLRDGLWALVMADVADKGVPAALFMVMCRTLLRAAAINRVAPAETLERVNRLILNDASTDLFVTLFYGLWDPASGEFSYASAGHNPSLFLRADTGEVSLLNGRGIALGVLADIEIEEHTITIEPGDMVIAYTDGVTEAMTEDYEEWGLERLISVVRANRASSADELVATILRSIDDFVAGASQSDDLTIWCLKRQRGA